MSDRSRPRRSASAAGIQTNSPKKQAAAAAPVPVLISASASAAPAALAAPVVVPAVASAAVVAPAAASPISPVSPAVPAAAAAASISDYDNLTRTMVEAWDVDNVVAWAIHVAKIDAEDAEWLRKSKYPGRKLLSLTKSKLMEARLSACAADDIADAIVILCAEFGLPPPVSAVVAAAAAHESSPPRAIAAPAPIAIPIPLHSRNDFCAALAASGMPLRTDAQRLHPPLHVMSVSSDMPFVARVDDIKKTYDENLVPSKDARGAPSIGIQASPGFGKTRFFLEFMQRAQPPAGVRFVFAPVTFNNTTSWLASDEGTLKPDQAIGYRMLYSHFVDPTYSWTRFLVWIRHVAHADVIQQAVQCLVDDLLALAPTTDRSQTILLIDELAKLDPGTTRPTEGLSAAHAAMRAMWTADFRPLLVFVSSLSPLSKAGNTLTSGQAMHWHRLSPLSEADVSQLLPDELCSTPLLRLARSDAGGHPRIISVLRDVFASNSGGDALPVQSYDHLVERIAIKLDTWALGNLSAFKNPTLVEALLIGRELSFRDVVVNTLTVDDLIGDGTLLHYGLSPQKGYVVPRVSMFALWRWAIGMKDTESHLGKLAHLYRAMFHNWAGEARISGQQAQAAKPWGEPYEQFHSQYLVLRATIEGMKGALVCHPDATSFESAFNLDKHWIMFPNIREQALAVLFAEYTKLIVHVGKTCSGFDLLEFTQRAAVWHMKFVQLKAGLDAEKPTPKLALEAVCNSICQAAPFLSNRSALLRLLDSFCEPRPIPSLKPFYTLTATGFYVLNTKAVNAHDNDRKPIALLLRRVLAACQDRPKRQSNLPDIDASRVTFEFLSLSQDQLDDDDYDDDDDDDDDDEDDVNTGAMQNKTKRKLSWAANHSGADSVVRVMLWQSLETFYGPNMASRLQFYLDENKREKEATLVRAHSQKQRRAKR